MTKDQIALGVSTGLTFFGPNSKAKIPSKFNDGIFFLKQFLNGVAQGELAITPVLQEDESEDVTVDSMPPPTLVKND